MREFKNVLSFYISIHLRCQYSRVGIYIEKEGVVNLLVKYIIQYMYISILTRVWA